MTHQDAVVQMAVEHYLLGELSGQSRDQFEEHLFECEECTADLKQGVLFLEGAKAELKASEPAWAADASLQRTGPQLFGHKHLGSQESGSQRFRPRLAWLWQARILAPALAACLAVIVYQSAVLLPGLRTEVAELQTPTVLEPFVLANAGARGDAVAEIQAPQHGFYALSVDIPPAASASAYRCSLYSPQGTLLWHVDVSPQRARDAITIQVPSATAQAGMNELRVESLSSGGDAKDSLVLLASYRYKLSFRK